MIRFAQIVYCINTIRFAYYMRVILYNHRDDDDDDEDGGMLL